MSLAGGIVGGALGAAGSIFGGIQASKAMKKVKKSLQEQQRRNQAWYDRRYNEDATQRADAQAVLSRTQESIRNRNRQGAGAQAVTGGTQEGVAAAQAANNDALAVAAAQIAAQGERRRDAVERQYRGNDSRYQQQLSNLEAGRAQAIGQAVSGVGSAAAGLGGVVDDFRDDGMKGSEWLREVLNESKN